MNYLKLSSLLVIIFSMFISVLSQNTSTNQPNNNESPPCKQLPNLEKQKLKEEQKTKEKKEFKNPPKGFRVSKSPTSVILSSKSINSSKPSGMKEFINSPPVIEEIILSKEGVLFNDEKKDSNLIDVEVRVSDPENDVLTYDYTVSVGRIISDGSKVNFSPKVKWDICGAKPGTYTITVTVDDGCGICAKPKTKTLTVLSKNDRNSLSNDESINTEKEGKLACDLPPQIFSIDLSQKEIILGCPKSDKSCSGKKTIDVSTNATTIGNERYIYTVSAGKIIGEGKNVKWDLSHVKSGYYTITVTIAQPSSLGKNGWAVFGETKTEIVIVKKY